MKHAKIVLIGLILSLSTAVAVATEKPKHEHGTSNPTTAIVTPSATAAASQGQGQAQSTDVNLANDVKSSSDAISSSGGNVLSTTTTYKQVRQPVNTAVAVAGVNTLQCVKTGAAGVQFIGIGASMSLPKKDKDCALENAADRAYARGNKSAGDKLTCMTSYMRELYPDPSLCLSAQNELVAVPRKDGTGNDYVNPEQEREARITAHPVGIK